MSTTQLCLHRLQMELLKMKATFQTLATSLNNQLFIDTNKYIKQTHWLMYV